MTTVPPTHLVRALCIRSLNVRLVTVRVRGIANEVDRVVVRRLVHGIVQGQTSAIAHVAEDRHREHADKRQTDD